MNYERFRTNTHVVVLSRVPQDAPLINCFLIMLKTTTSNCTLIADRQ